MSLIDILQLFRQGKGTARSHMKNLIEMAIVDGSFDLIEHDLLIKIAERNQIEESQLRSIHDNPNKIPFILPVDKQERFNQFYDLVHMMYIDKTIHPEEMKLCNIFATKFGYGRDESDNLIESIQFGIVNRHGRDETYKEVESMLP